MRAKFIEGDTDNKHGFWVEPASAVGAAFVLNHEQRSGWNWFRLPNGDLVMGCYPQDACYEATEEWRTI